MGNPFNPQSVLQGNAAPCDQAVGGWRVRNRSWSLFIAGLGIVYIAAFPVLPGLVDGFGKVGEDLTYGASV
jgi:hypothetical protein